MIATAFDEPPADEGEAPSVIVDLAAQTVALLARWVKGLGSAATAGRDGRDRQLLASGRLGADSVALLNA